MVIQLQSLKIGIRSCAAQKVPPGSKTYKDLMHLQGSKQVASPEAVLFPRPPFMCFMQTFSKCTTISCISRDKTNEKIFITKADKGGKVVVMDKQIYIRNCETQLDNTEFYEKISLLIKFLNVSCHLYGA